MTITHAKVSGLTNPSDPDLVGGEDWDDPHVVSGPTLIDSVMIRLTTGGAILTQSYGLLAFTKTATGTYRADYDEADYGGSPPMIVACLSVDTGAPSFVRWTLENDGDDYVQLVTIDDTGAALNIASANLSLTASAILT